MSAHCFGTQCQEIHTDTLTLNFPWQESFTVSVSGEISLSAINQFIQNTFTRERLLEFSGQIFIRKTIPSLSLDVALTHSTTYIYDLYYFLYKIQVGNRMFLCSKGSQ